MMIKINAADGTVEATVMPREHAEKIVAFFDANPDRADCKAHVPGLGVMVVRRDDHLPRIREALGRSASENA